MITPSQSTNSSLDKSYEKFIDEQLSLKNYAFNLNVVNGGDAKILMNVLQKYRNNKWTVEAGHKERSCLPCVGKESVWIDLKADYVGKVIIKFSS